MLDDVAKNHLALPGMLQTNKKTHKQNKTKQKKRKTLPGLIHSFQSSWVSGFPFRRLLNNRSYLHTNSLLKHFFVIRPDLETKIFTFVSNISGTGSSFSEHCWNSLKKAFLPNLTKRDYRSRKGKFLLSNCLQQKEYNKVTSNTCWAGEIHWSLCLTMDSNEHRILPSTWLLSNKPHSKFLKNNRNILLSSPNFI